MTDNIPDEDVVILMDPDWRDHFREVSEAADFYRRYSRPEWDEAVAEIDWLGSDQADGAVTVESGA